MTQFGPLGEKRLNEMKRKTTLLVLVAFLISSITELCVSPAEPAKPKEGAFKVGEGLYIGFLWPLRVSASSQFGTRHDPISTDIVKHHVGLDIAVPGGTHVVASHAGRVTFAGTRGGYGKLVILSHANDMETRYGHLSALKVKQGHFVRPGQVLGTVGDTGRSTGNHLHFEIRESGHAVDPMKWLVPYGYMMPLKYTSP